MERSDPTACGRPAAGAGGCVGAAGDEISARVRLAGVPGLSPRTAARLLADLGSARAVLAASPERLRRVPGVGAARAALIAGAPSPADAARDLQRAGEAGAAALAPLVPGWPAALSDLADPPVVLWVRGDLAGAMSSALPASPTSSSPPAPPCGAAAAADGGPRAPADPRDAIGRVLAGRGVAIVGSRRASTYGRQQAERLAADLAALGVPIVSGLARGVDAAAHRGALRGGGRTVGVLGGGLARFYPPEHVPLAREIVAAAGAVVSEFPLDMPPLPHHFPRRNRLLAAMSAAVVVVEAADRSGSLLTADHALDLGREVLAVPGRVDSENSRGVHRLLREGAAVCESAADVLAALGIEADAGPCGPAGGDGAPAAADPVEARLLAALAADEQDADALLDATGIPAAAALAALTVLELRGAVRLGDDGRYSLVRVRGP